MGKNKRIGDVCHSEEPSDFLNVLKMGGDEESHHKEYEICLK